MKHVLCNTANGTIAATHLHESQSNAEVLIVGNNVPRRNDACCFWSSISCTIRLIMLVNLSFEVCQVNKN